MTDDLEALRALSERYGVPGIDLSQIAILLTHLELLPRAVAESRRLLCVLARGERVFLVMANPHDRRAIDEIEFATGRKVYPYVATEAAIAKTIAAAYDALAEGEAYYLGPHVPAETLRQLGLPEERRPRGAKATAGLTAGPAAASSARGPGAAPAATAARRSARSEPAPPPLVLEERTQRVAERAEVSVSDFGTLTEEVSKVSLPPPPSATPTKGDGKLVLVVDDEHEIRKLLRRLLEQKGFRVAEAERGNVALRLVRELVPDVIVLDAMLPELHGFDIAKRLKGSERYGRIPIVMVSAVYKGWNIAQDLKANYGIDEYLEKPFKIGDLVATITRLLEGGAAPAAAPARDPEALHRDARQALEEGIGAYRRGDIEGAIAHLKRGIGIDPLSYRLRFHLALLYGKKEQVYEAIHELERAVDLNPHHFPAQKNLAVLYEKGGFKQKAVEMWTRCVPLAPDDATRASVKQHLLELL